MKVWLAREYMGGSTEGVDWTITGRRIVALDEHDAAEKFAQWQCQQEPGSYRLYEDGKLIEIKLYAADQSDNAALHASVGEGSILIKVSVSFDPQFHSRVEHKLKDCAHASINTAPVLVSGHSHNTRKCPDCGEIVSVPNLLGKVSFPIEQPK